MRLVAPPGSANGYVCYTAISFEQDVNSALLISEDHYAQARAESRRWCIHPGFKTQPKSETERTIGSTK